MRKYWIEKTAFIENSVSFDGETFHHIFSVCRQEVGSEFIVLSEDGLARKVKVTAVKKKTATADILSSEPVPALKKPLLNLYISVARFPVMDAVVEKMVELGVATITPFVSNFSFIRSHRELKEDRLVRWKKIVVSATQQCGRGELLKLNPVVDFSGLVGDLKQKQNSLVVFAYEGKCQLTIKQFLQNQKFETIDNIHFIVGSEGGFSKDETAAMSEAWFTSVTLGDQVMRVETACIALASILKYQSGLLE